MVAAAVKQQGMRPSPTGEWDRTLLQACGMLPHCKMRPGLDNLSLIDKSLGLINSL